MCKADAHAFLNVGLNKVKINAIEEENYPLCRWDALPKASFLSTG